MSSASTFDSRAVTDLSCPYLCHRRRRRRYPPPLMPVPTTAITWPAQTMNDLEHPSSERDCKTRKPRRSTNEC